MRFSYISVLALPAIALAQAAPSRAELAPSDVTPTPQAILTQPNAAVPSTLQTIIQPTGAATLDEQKQRLELRQNDVTDAAETVATQMSPVTVVWQETEIASGVTTYVPITYSQSFASVPTQDPAPGSGTIGLGTLTGESGAVKTGAAQKGSGSPRGAPSRGLLGVVGAAAVGVVLGGSIAA